MENIRRVGIDPVRKSVADTLKTVLRTAGLVASSIFLSTGVSNADSLVHYQVAEQRADTSLSPTWSDTVPVSRPAVYNQLLAASFANNSDSLEYVVDAVKQTDRYGYGAGYFVNGLTGSNHWYQVALVYNWPGHDGHKNYYFKGFYMLFNVFYCDENGNVQKLVGMRKFDKQVKPGDRVDLRLYFADGRVILSARDLNTGGEAQVSFRSSDDIFLGTDDFQNPNGFFTGLMTERHSPIPKFGNLSQVRYSPVSRIGSPAHLFEMELNKDSNETNQFVSHLINDDYIYDVKTGNGIYQMEYTPGGDFTTGSG